MGSDRDDSPDLNRALPAVALYLVAVVVLGALLAPVLQHALNAITGDVAFLGIPNQRGIEMAVGHYGQINLLAHQYRLAASGG